MSDRGGARGWYSETLEEMAHCLVMADSSNTSVVKNLTVLYDGDCPICEREIEYYQRQNGADALNWLDIGVSSGERCPPQVSRAVALSRFHVICGNGEVLRGAEAFSAIWLSLPSFKRLGAIARKRPFIYILKFAYELFLIVRPSLQTWAKRRTAVEVRPAKIRRPAGSGERR